MAIQVLLNKGNVVCIDDLGLCLFEIYLDVCISGHRLFEFVKEFYPASHNVVNRETLGRLLSRNTHTLTQLVRVHHLHEFLGECPLVLVGNQESVLTICDNILRSRG